MSTPLTRAVVQVASLAALLFAASVDARTQPHRRRLPHGFAYGRCILDVDGKRYISGLCEYQFGKDGGVELHGPRQVWPGIDYPDPHVMSGEHSADYFAQINFSDGTWDASWNEDIRAVHAQSLLGKMTRKGSCWANKKARICVWKR